MLPKLVKAIKAPFTTYISLTITDPCRTISQQKRQRAGAKRKQDNSPAPFSMIKHIQKQREHTSPNTGGKVEVSSPREQYVRETYLPPDSQRWVH